MLNITKTIEYGLIAMRHISEQNNLCSAKEISEIYHVPKEIMAKTMQKLCRKGYKNISWFLVLLPFITMFVLIAIFMLSLLHR